MEIIKFLMANYDIDGGQDIAALWQLMASQFSHDDFIEFANIAVLMDNLPKALSEKIWAAV